MALTDFLHTLEAGTAKSRRRRADSEAFISTIAQASMSGGGGGGGRKRGGGGKGGGPVGKYGKGRLGQFLHAISDQESGGNYGARGVQTKYGQALGKYQILDANIPAWSREVLGRSISPQRFLHSPRLQEKIARGKLTQYYRQYGAQGAAKAWYAGPGNAYTNSSRSQYGGPSINDYASSVLRKMQRYR